LKQACAKTAHAKLSSDPLRSRVQEAYRMTSTTAETVAGRWSDRLTGWRVWALLAIAVVAWLPGVMALPALDRDESRFAQASRQMVETGNYIDIRLGAAPRYNKPIGIYWLQSAVVKAARVVVRNAQDKIAFYRLPSFLCGLLALFLTFWTTRAFASVEVSFFAAALLGLTLLLAAESEIATTDAALLAAILAAQGVLLRAKLAFGEQRALPRGLTLAGWVAVGAGILIKGPVIAGVLGATALALSLWERDWRWLKATRLVSGVAAAIAVAAPWAIAIGLASHGAFYKQSLGHDFAAKIAGGQESHGAPPGYFLVLTNLAFWPATLFLIPALDLAVRRRNEPAVRFLIAWAASAFVLFELVPTKLPHYILPAYPALAILAALWVAETPALPETRWQRLFRTIACVQFGLVALAFAAVPFVLPQRFGASSPSWTTLSSLLGMLAAGAAIFLTVRRERRGALAAAGICALLFYPTLTAGVAPQLRQLWISERVASAVARDARPHDPPLVSAGYAEPSLLFRLGGSTRLATGEAAANIAAAQGGVALITDDERGAFLARLVELQAIAVPVDQLSGFDYSRGRKEHMTLYRVSQVPQELDPPAE
jgi:4-amino-4-deoxy-L-arabinose transferase-like glycosyltransferase